MTAVFFRGYPQGDGSSAANLGRHVLDLVFTGVRRIACRTDFDFLSLRCADDAQRSVLEESIGWILPVHHVYLLEAGSAEHYVIAEGVSWAEVASDGSMRSPLWGTGIGNEKYLPKPIGDTIHYHYDPRPPDQRFAGLIVEDDESSATQ